MWGGTNTFNSYIPTTILNPTTNYQLTNKLYVDSNLNNNTNNLQYQITSNYVNQIGLSGIVYSYNKNINKLFNDLPSKNTTWTGENVFNNIKIGNNIIKSRFTNTQVSRKPLYTSLKNDEIVHNLGNKCEVSPWSDWSKCSKITKTMTRTRNVIVEPLNKGTCPDLIETKHCFLK